MARRQPGRAPQVERYASAGTANADVTPWIAGRDGSRIQARWDRGAFEYVLGAAGAGLPRPHRDGIAVTPAGLQLRAVLGVDDDEVLFTASAEPTETQLWTYQALYLP